MNPTQTAGSSVRRHARGIRMLLVGTLSALALTLVPAAPAAQAAPTPGSYAPNPCPVPVPQGVRVDCGTLTVAESRRNPTGKTIQLAVAILRAPRPNNDPIVFLAGGPGQGAISLLPLLARSYGPTIATRDMVLIDQRGTGFSKPSLTCSLDGPGALLKGFQPGVAVEDLPAQVQQLAAFYAACVTRYREQGVDLSAYNSVESAADLEDLRVALGASQLNLLGGSYGSRLALTAMRYRPDTIRSAVLDSVYPLQSNFHVDVFRTFEGALQKLSDGCAADEACNRAYPDLLGKFDATVERMNTNVPALPITNIETNQVIDYIPISGNDYATIVFQLLYSTPDITVLPLIIDQTSKGDYRILARIFSILLQGGGPGISLGMQIAVQCNEDATFASERDFVEARDEFRRAQPLSFIPTFNESYLAVCEAAGISGSPSPDENAPVESAIPSFIIGGEYDPITPPENIAEVSSTLSNAFSVIVPRGGHTPSATSPCLGRAIAAFFDNPGQRPDTACLTSEAPQPFVVR